jgi:hypothetical protein
VVLSYLSPYRLLFFDIKMTISFQCPSLRDSFCQRSMGLKLREAVVDWVSHWKVMVRVWGSLVGSAASW